MENKVARGTLNELWADSDHWVAVGIYHCKADPRLIVPKRIKWGGWTLTFAHTSAWLVLLVCIASIVVPIICLANSGMTGTWPWYAFLAAIVLFWCVVSAIAASPRRYEAAE